MPEPRKRRMAGDVSTKSAPRTPGSPRDPVGARIKEMGGWQAETLLRLRSLIRQADPGVVEDVKWKKPTNPGGVPVWYHDGIMCTGEAYKSHVRVTFARGALLKDPKGIFNASLKGNAFRAIVISEGGKIDEKGFMALVRSAVALNTSRRA
jgi:hypothetical protein